MYFRSGSAEKTAIQYIVSKARVAHFKTTEISKLEFEVVAVSAKLDPFV